MDGGACCRSGIGSDAAVNHARVSQTNESRLQLRAAPGSTLDDVQGESGQRRLLIAGLHIQSCLVHGLDDLVE
jgi:hypothetical protein